MKHDWSINLTCPRCQFTGDASVSFDCCDCAAPALAEVERLKAALADSERVRGLLREALRIQDPRNSTERYELIADAFTRKTGHVAPGRSMPAAMAYLPDDDDRRHALWRAFCNEWHERFFDEALAAADALRSKGGG